MIGSRLGPYEIIAKLGEGGMGEVWRATDSNLRRDVAIKVLPAAFTADRERLLRFEREAQLLAKLQHPNIASIYGLEESQGVRALVMELVEGPTLAERLECGPLPVAEAVSVALQIAQALEDAHQKGIVHRDLKPQNVKASPEGRVKVLDFGLAKAMSPAAGTAESANSPTITFDGTREGVILGTAAYMAPEQARGGGVDARADIWALGVILFEMLTGERLFTGGSAIDTLSAVMRMPIDLARLPSGTPLRLRELVRRMLERHPAERLHHVADARIVLAELAREGPSAWLGDLPAKSRAGGTTSGLPRWIPVLGGLAAGVFLAWLGLTRLGTGRSGAAAAPSDAEVRFRVPPPSEARFSLDVEGVQLAVSPDGATLAFVARSRTALAIWLRRIDELEPRLFAGTEGARSLAWSPDGQAIAFFAGGKLKRIELAGGAAVPICDAPAGTGLAASWGSAGEILFATVRGDGIYQVSATGGVAEKIVDQGESLDAPRTGWPQFLPDGKSFLYLRREANHVSQLMLVEPGKSPRAVAPLDSRFELAGEDLLVFAREGALLGQRLDRAAGRLTGAPISISPKVRYFYSSAWAGFGTSRGGTLFFVSEASSDRLGWFDRAGIRGEAVGAEGSYLDVSLSRDGGTLLAARSQPDFGTYDLWQIDVERGVESRLTSSPDADFAGMTLDAGKSIVYSKLRGVAPNLFRRDLATGREELLAPSAAFQEATDVSPDGRLLAFLERDPSGKFQGWTLRLDGEHKPERLFPSDDEVKSIRFSSDGRFIAYISDASGEPEVYVSPLATPAHATRVTTHGAWELLWSRDGRELFILGDDRKLVSVAVRTAPALEIGATTALFTLPEGMNWFDFDVTPDGRRFVAIVNERAGGQQSATAIVGWHADAAR